METPVAEPIPNQIEAPPVEAPLGAQNLKHSATAPQIEVPVEAPPVKASLQDPTAAERAEPRAAVTSFKTVPSDIKRAVLSFIDRPTDLKNLCLTSKDLRELVTPVLYRSIHLFVGGPQDLRLSAFLAPGNPGIKHVKQVFLRLEKLVIDNKRHQYSDDSSEEEEGEENAVIPGRQAQFTVRLLLDFLPHNQLEIFSWQNWEPLSAENFILLCKRQKTLRVLEIGPMDRLLDPLLDKEPGLFDSLKDLNSIDVYPDSIDRLRAAQKLLKSKPKVQNLCVSTGFEYSSEEPPDLHDFSTRPGLLSRTLFSHMLPFETCDPLILKNLDLDSIQLRYAADTWLKLIKFSNMEKLEIRNCAGADAVFAQLSKPHLRPAKLKSLRWMDDGKSEPHAMDALEGFVEALAGLETLHVDISNMRGLPRVLPIVQHKKTLTSLSLHSQLDRHTQYTYSEVDFLQLCMACSEVRQLSVMFPTTQADASHPSPEFTVFTLHILKLRKLATLNIRRWPGHLESFSGSHSRVVPIVRHYEHHLQRLSQRIFENSDGDAKEHGYGFGHRSPLSVVCWGGNGRSKHDPSDKYRLKQIPFVRGRKIDPFGQSSMLAVQTIWRLVQFVEPESDILNHSLYDMHDVHESLGF